MPFYDDSTWMIVKATLARRLSCCQDFEDAVISYNTKFKDLWKRLYNCWVQNHITWAIWIVYDTIPYGINYILFDQMTIIVAQEIPFTQDIFRERSIRRGETTFFQFYSSNNSKTLPWRRESFPKIATTSEKAFKWSGLLDAVPVWNFVRFSSKSSIDKFCRV